MTWKFASFTVSLGVAAAMLALTNTPSNAQDRFMPYTTTVALDPADNTRETLGSLEYRGGLQIEPGDHDIGGISGLEWHDGKLYAVSDDGQWLILTPDEIGDRLTDIIEIETGPLLDTDGKRLRGKAESDAEAIARTATGDWLVAFEQNHRIWRYPDLSDDAEPFETSLIGLVQNAESNGGLETLAASPGGLLACVETPSRMSNCMMQVGSETTLIDLDPPTLIAERTGAPTDADCASNGVCYILFRSYSRALGNGAAIMAIGPDGNRETLASWTDALTIDNFEGLTVREDGARTYLYIVSDNNFSDSQRNLLMKFEVDPRAATAPGIPEKVYATELVVLETTMGDITVSLETERAPVTAANFLRYVDEDRYDDTRCYRAMHVTGGEQPSGFLQCGTQNDPRRILDGIEHEPTNETGLSHTDGALSMARFEPGTATGDFSIMIRDQRGLDAVPDSDDPERRPGFAVFGYVIDGMDVVHAIHATPRDPDKGEDFLKGQMLAEPVTIVDVRRIEPSQ